MKVTVIIVTVCFMLADILTGLVRAWYERDVKSDALRAGLFHKISFLVSICLAAGLEYAATVVPQIQIELPIANGVCAYIILTEVVSILENIKAVNPQIGGIADRLTPHTFRNGQKPDNG